MAVACWRTILNGLELRRSGLLPICADGGRQQLSKPVLIEPAKIARQISLVEYHIAMDGNPLKRRRRQPRVRDNPMARIAHDVMVEAERALRRADALSAGMEPHLLKRVTDSTIYAYTNDREDRNVPPGDVLLAAALVAGISLDRKLGLTSEAPETDLDDLRAQMAEMRREMASLRAEVVGQSGSPADGAPTADDANTKVERAAQRRSWARQSGAAGPPPSSTPSPRRGGRGTAP
jgi:hypothetical protein